MSTINTNNLRVKNAKNFVSSLQTDGAYIFVGRPVAWDETPTVNNGVGALYNATDNSPPKPSNSLREYNSVHDEMISLNKILETEVYHMIPRNTWTSGAVYDTYRHDYSETNRSYSGASNLYNTTFAIINQNNDIYVCLDNDKNTQSTVEPQNTGNEPFYTSDGYQWLRIYSINSTDSFDFSTNNYIPVTNTNVVTTISGAVYTAIIEVPGNNYTGSPSGVVNNIPYYYCNIVGDGTGAVARVSVSGGSVIKIEVVRPGSGYTHGTVQFIANKTYQSLGDLDSDANGLNPMGDGTFSATVIPQPPGGWGTDTIRELGGTRVGVFSSLNYDLYYYTQSSTFRQVGILQGPSFITQNSPIVATAYNSVKVTDLGGVSDYSVGETIIQITITDGVTTTAKGTLVGWDKTTGVLRYIQDNEFHSDTDGILKPFTGGAYIQGESSGKITQPDLSFTGTSTEVTFTTGYSNPILTPYTGYISYLTNISPVLRTTTQTERVRLIIGY
tara:strand:- start:12976 stop:14475 length:1500 start_codon:yes stop_codon:yes gene_type:complete